jgi:hypothetical protein
LEAAAKLAAGPVGSTWKLTLHKMRATSVYEFARATFYSPPFLVLDLTGAAHKAAAIGEDKNADLAERIGIEPTSVQRLPDRQRF